ncbi:hypothetical protein FA15DRAFT_701061 [Coprinopsis marcescibilis]|uniref:Uncharacterized protein n=1 Tax=Coprinopsis marcescibilis TaxID=230819 RepID=A0A5C3L6G4_COPMA|nr:hypothetical protein FA15DRAFT_701061 [Coprinopsis marcescibilis]
MSCSPLTLQALQEDLIGQQALESLHKTDFSEERLVLAICKSRYYDPIQSHHAYLTMHVMSEYAKTVTNSHRAVFVFSAYWWQNQDQELVHWFERDMANQLTFDLVRIEFKDWPPSERSQFNAKYGDMIRAGAECLDVVLEVRAHIIKYVLNHEKFRVEEEMISWNPVVSSKAGKIYKKTLATLTPGPFENYPINPDM